ncbi:MAG: hypothetical protein E7409_04360 [Ruminococcaceae bacterium]|nr:hypothetical protein [Oscillospiraceae bacterium]
MKSKVLSLMLAMLMMVSMFVAPTAFAAATDPETLTVSFEKDGSALAISEVYAGETVDLVVTLSSAEVLESANLSFAVTGMTIAADAAYDFSGMASYKVGDLDRFKGEKLPDASTSNISFNIGGGDGVTDTSAVAVTGGTAVLAKIPVTMAAAGTTPSVVIGNYQITTNKVDPDFGDPRFVDGPINYPAFTALVERPKSITGVELVGAIETVQGVVPALGSEALRAKVTYDEGSPEFINVTNAEVDNDTKGAYVQIGADDVDEVGTATKTVTVVVPDSYNKTMTAELTVTVIAEVKPTIVVPAEVSKAKIDQAGTAAITFGIEGVNRAYDSYKLYAVAPANVTAKIGDANLADGVAVNLAEGASISFVGTAKTSGNIALTLKGVLGSDEIELATANVAIKVANEELTSVVKDVAVTSAEILYGNADAFEYELTYTAEYKDDPLGESIWGTPVVLTEGVTFTKDGEALTNADLVGGVTEITGVTAEFVVAEYDPTSDVAVEGVETMTVVWEDVTIAVVNELGDKVVETAAITEEEIDFTGETVAVDGISADVAIYGTELVITTADADVRGTITVAGYTPVRVAIDADGLVTLDGTFVAGDSTADGAIDVVDFYSIAMNQAAEYEGELLTAYDFNRDRAVDDADLATMFANKGDVILEEGE